MKIEQVVEYKACITCVYRRPYPAGMREGQPVFYRFYCSLAADSNKELVRPEEVCKFWKGASLGIE